LKALNCRDVCLLFHSFDVTVKVNVGETCLIKTLA